MPPTPAAALLLLPLQLLLRSSRAATEDMSPFFEDYLSEEFFWSPLYNAIDCTGEVIWPRLVSSASHGLLSMHRPTESIGEWVNPKEPQTFLLNVNCPGAETLLGKANESHLFRRPFQWLLFDDRNHSSVVRYLETLKNYRILLDAEVRLTAENRDGSIGIVGVYKISPEGELLQEPVAEWRRDGGMDLLTRDCAAVRRWNVRGAKLTGSFVVTHPDTLDHLEDLVDKHIDPSSKVGYAVAKHLAEMINASLEVKLSDGWGRKINGTYDGMIGEVQSGVSEIGLSPIFVMKERVGVIQYYEMLTPTRAKFILMSPPLTFSSNIFAMPFDGMVWLCSLVTVLLSCLLLYVATKMETRAREDDFRGLRGSFGDILILNIGAICMQGAPVEPKGPSGRIITIFLYFSYMFLYVSYSGSIVALLQSSDTSIRTFQDLIESPLTVGADDVAYSQFYFKNENEPIRKALYEKKIAPKGDKPHFLPPEEGVEKLRKGLYAYHVETSVGYSLIQRTFTEDEKCSLQEFKISFFQTVDPMVIMRINSPFAEMVKIGTKKIMEVGLDHRIVSRIYTKKPVCTSKSSRFVSVGLVDCYHAFFIVAYGVALAWFILLAERLSHRRLRGLQRGAGAAASVSKPRK